MNFQNTNVMSKKKIIVKSKYRVKCQIYVYFAFMLKLVFLFHVKSDILCFLLLWKMFTLLLFV